MFSCISGSGHDTAAASNCGGRVDTRVVNMFTISLSLLFASVAISDRVQQAIYHPRNRIYNA